MTSSNLERRVQRLEAKYEQDGDLSKLSDAELALVIFQTLEGQDATSVSEDEEAVRGIARDYDIESELPLPDLLARLRVVLMDWATGRVHAWSGWQDGSGRPLGPTGRVPLSVGATL